MTDLLTDEEINLLLHPPELFLKEFQEEADKLIVLLSDEREIHLPKKLIPFFLLENGSLNPVVFLEKKDLCLHQELVHHTLSLEELLSLRPLENRPYSGFAFENLADFDGRALQAFLMDIDDSTLMLALEKPNHPLCKIIFQNISRNRQKWILSGLSRYQDSKPDTKSVHYARHQIEQKMKDILYQLPPGYPKS